MCLLCLQTKGAATDERTLIRVMVSRSEIDMADIEQKFQDNYDKKLKESIKVIYMYINWHKFMQWGFICLFQNVRTK